MRRVPWVALAALSVGGGLWLAALLQPWAGLLPNCPFKRMTGLACATCGLTRCAMALGSGDWLGAFHWHPAAVVFGGLLPPAVLWDFRRAWRSDPYPALPDSRIARVAIWLVLLGVWALQAARGI